MKKVSLLLVVVLILTMVLCACGGKNALVGSWSATQDGVTATMTFNDDGTGSLSAMGGILSISFTYTAENNVIAVTPADGFEDFMEYTEFEYVLNGDSLTLTNEDEELVLTRDE